MAQARRLFEVAALAAALVAGVVVAGPALAQEPAATTPPKGADYQTSIQCAGLHAALAVFSPNDGAKNDERHAARFKEWALIRAPEANKTPGMVNTDIETARKNFVRDGGKGRNATRWKTLVDRYNYQWNTCRNMSDVREYIAVESRAQ
jgi:hypothetical protein